ncbi:hypothetical protein H5410_015169 [Solanum commersonii]|uniref:Uncharacterized protein n=1 Tax=Solanum commersonii TaxID=4109 RepID=A0A9J5ZT24_SOLCO|nr:hypothetical protein H5410_015169 [Solanum commersonii]
MRLEKQETRMEIYKKIKENSIPLARWFESFVAGFELSSEFLLWWRNSSLHLVHKRCFLVYALFCFQHQFLHLFATVRRLLTGMSYMVVLINCCHKLFQKPGLGEVEVLVVPVAAYNKLLVWVFRCFPSSPSSSGIFKSSAGLSSACLASCC